jgi:hypothetical protein
MLKHVVFFKFKPETREEDITDLENHLAALPNTIPEIKEYEFGRDIIRSDRSYDFALVSSFDDVEAMKRYQTHPDHVIVINKVKAICDNVLAVDFMG